jgi:hypothetical protein
VLMRAGPRSENRWREDVYSAGVAYLSLNSLWHFLPAVRDLFGTFLVITTPDQPI